MSENYGVDFTQELKKYSDCIVWKSNMTVEEVTDLFTVASCILLHDSFDNNVKIEIIDLSKKQNIPLVIFSGSITATVFYSNLNVRIKKDRMYHNLLTFIENFRSKNVIDLELLHLGSNYNKLKAEIIQDRLFYSALLSNSNFNYSSTFISESKEYKDLKELLYLSNPNVEIESAFSEFEEDLLNKDVDIVEMKNIIKQLVKKVINNGKFFSN